MQGTISFDGTLSGSIAGGGGGGSEVTITPTLSSGTKIADYEIDGTPGELYAPTPESLSATSPLSISSGVISIDLSDYDTTTEIAATYATKSEVNAVDLNMQNYVDNNFQPLLVAGANININPITHEISADTWDYSTSEQDTGHKWIDGKEIYQLTISIPTYSSADFNISLADYNIDQVVDLISTAKSYYTYDGGIHWDDRRFVGNYSTQGTGYFLIYRIECDHETPLSLRCIIQGFPITRLSSYHTIYYTKTI